MYGYLLLKIQKKEISKETQAAVNQIGKLLRLLTERYKTMYQEEE
jgi:very-short-patch-repair endonuclease